MTRRSLSVATIGVLLVISLCPPRAGAYTEGSIQPSDIFKDFPTLKFGMSFEEAKKAVTAAGAQPLGNETKKAELTWEGKFNDMNGRATLLFKEDVGLWEIAVVVYAMDKRHDVFETWSKKISEKIGTPAHAESMDHISNKWDSADKVELELRLIKDDDSPVVDIHWVKN